MAANCVRREKAALSSGCESHPAKRGVVHLATGNCHCIARQQRVQRTCLCFLCGSSRGVSRLDRRWQSANVGGGGTIGKAFLRRAAPKRRSFLLLWGRGSTMEPRVKVRKSRGYFVPAARLPPSLKEQKIGRK
jgi:hypothetical protein